MVPRHDVRRAARSRRRQASPDTLEVRWRRELREGDACDTARAGPTKNLSLPYAVEKRRPREELACVEGEAKQRGFAASATRVETIEES